MEWSSLDKRDLLSLAAFLRSYPPRAHIKTKEDALSCSFGLRNRGLAVTLRLTSRHGRHTAKRTERRKRNEWIRARIPALAWCQERHALKIAGDDGKAGGGGRRKLERDHGSVVTAARLRVNMRNLRSQLSLN